MIPKVSGTILSDSLEILVGQTKGWESWSQVSSFDTVSVLQRVRHCTADTQLIQIPDILGSNS